VRPRYLAFALLLVPALAQVGLLDGPRPPTEVRGTLQGNPRDGYKVAVEFLVDQGVEPLQGTVFSPSPGTAPCTSAPGRATPSASRGTPGVPFTARRSLTSTTARTASGGGRG
jgi:hypothetical protein